MRRKPSIRLALLALLSAGPAMAQGTPASLQFPSRPPPPGTPAHRGEIRMGVPDDAPPFAFVGVDGRPGGYAVEACGAVAAAIAAAAGSGTTGPDDPAVPHAVALRFVRLPVAAEAAALADGTIDLGCSAVAGTAAGVAASPPLAVSGTRLRAARLGPVSSLGDLAGRTVAVVAGSRAADSLARAGAVLSPPPVLRAVPGPGDGYELLATGAADAFAADDLVLAGLLATRTDGPSFRIIGRPLDREPLALRFRAGDPGLAATVDGAFARMRADGTLRAGYLRWFTQPLPGAAALDRPPSPDTDAVLGAAPGR